MDQSSLQDDAFVARGGKLTVVVFNGVLAQVPRLGFMGSPSVASERIKGETALYLAGTELSRYCGITTCVATLWYLSFI